MDAPSRLRWLRVVLCVGVVYLVVGLAVGTLAGRAASHQMRTTLRLAAWVISAAAFATHIAYEQIRLGSSPGKTALHASLAAALGAFALAVAANVHALAAAVHQPSHTLALVLWPVLTALPAFAAALVAAAGLASARRSH
jgi:hypothetical protein